MSDPKATPILAEALLDCISVKAWIPGRIRFRLAFAGDAFLRDAMRRELQRLDSVRLESYSSRTRTALVIYDVSRVKADEVAVALCRGVKEFARVHGECDLEDHRHPGRVTLGDHDHAHDHAHDHDHDHLATDDGIRKEAVKLAATGSVLWWLVVRRFRGLSPLRGAGPLTDLGALLTLVSGYPILKSGAESVRRGKPTDDTLIGIAVLATLLLGESITGLSVVWLIQLGRLLESVTLKRSRLAIADFMDMAPPEAWRLSPGRVDPNTGHARPSLAQLPVEVLEKGDVVRVFHFEKVPLDGRVIAGAALVQEGFITGEALPREKKPGDTVYAGSVVESGQIDVEVKSLVHETLIARMVASVQSLQEKRAPIERIGNRFASRFVPLSLLFAGATLVITRDWYKAVTMLVIACPCAAGLATPTAVSASIGGAARKGILIKGGVHLEKAARVDAVVFDKTGTLTVGAPVLCTTRLTKRGEARGESECLRLTAAVERHATHPLALAVVKEARARQLEFGQVENYEPHPGLGVQGWVARSRVQVGSLAYMRKLDVAVDEEFTHEVEVSQGAAGSIIYVAVDGELHAVLTIADAIRPEARAALEALRNMGIRRILLATGDRAGVAHHVARELGIDEVHAEMLPEGKYEVIDRLRAEGHHVAMVGDGVNDAQALAHADVSIAMGEGRCDLAIETADVTLARSNLMLVPGTLFIARTSLRTIYENLAASIGVNLVGLGFGALGKLSPFTAAIVHNLSTIAVVLNSFDLQRRMARSTATEWASGSTA